MNAPLVRTRILIAEDERHVRMLLRVVLQAAGATVVEAEDGQRALRLMELDDEGFDVLVTDLNMPEMDGPALVAAARLRWPDLPVVVCSARPVRELAPQLNGLLQGVVMKPFVPADLVRVVAVAAAAPRLRVVAG